MDREGALALWHAKGRDKATDRTWEIANELELQDAGKDEVQCRYDWHQTAAKVVVAVYAKKYDPSASTVEVSPVRLKIKIYFPERGGCFNLNLDLGGVISVSESSASMMGTKVELHLHKADAGSWGSLSVPRKPAVPALVKSEDSKPVEKEPEPEPVDALDLDDLVSIS